MYFVISALESAHVFLLQRFDKQALPENTSAIWMHPGQASYPFYRPPQHTEAHHNTCPGKNVGR